MDFGLIIIIVYYAKCSKETMQFNAQKQVHIVNAILCQVLIIIKLKHCRSFAVTHSLTATRNRLWVVAPSMLTGHQR